jgi:predicted ATPase/class 3 adenylate cyclase
VGAPVSLVMTDIVDSTRLWALHALEMVVDLEAHDRTVGEVVASFGGSVFKHTGDGALAVFEDPAAAVQAAAEIQRAIASRPWRVPESLRVRVAVNTGTVVERDGDYYGPPVNRVARLVGACPPGAVLLGQATVVLLTETALDGVELRRVGQLQLKGLSHPEPVHALEGVGLTEVAPFKEELEVAVPLGSLPISDEPLLGRGEQLKAVSAAVLVHPVTSIVGVGGMGKTRLAVEVATGLAGEFADGAWWCDLSVATSAEAVAPVILDALGSRQAPGRSPTESICDGLTGRNALVVLDNCEHVLDVVRELLVAVRTSCPTIRVLTTGREAVGVRGEHVIPLSSLPIEDAVTLFVDRALATRPDIELGDDALVAARQVCVRLDGIPLAIELAAARCRSMSPSEVNERLTDRFRLLRSGRPTSERHRTLQAAVAWSYDLLADAERDLFEQLAVFADGSLLDGIAVVADIDDYDALDLLDGLVARSMVVPEATPLGTRYRQLETLRQYAEDRLIERGTITDVRDRHLRSMRELAWSIRTSEGTPSAAPAFRRYCAEVDNFRVAVAHAITTGQRETANEIVAYTWRCASFRPTLEVRRWFDSTHGPPPMTESAADALGVHAFLAFVEGDVERVGDLVAAIPPEYHHLAPVAQARWLHETWCNDDPDAGEQALSECRARRESEALLMASLRVGCGYARMFLAEATLDLIQTTRRDAAEGLAAARRLGDDINTAGALITQAFAHAYSDDFETACTSALEAVALAESVGTGYLVDTARLSLSLALARLAAAGSREAPYVAATIRHSIELARQRQDRNSAVNMLDAVAVLIAPYEPEISYLLNVVYRRVPGAVIPANPPADVALERRVELEAEAATITLDDAVALALDTLDRHYPR